jgi:hypothetical protein
MTNTNVRINRFPVLLHIKFSKSTKIYLRKIQSFIRCLIASNSFSNTFNKSAFYRDIISNLKKMICRRVSKEQSDKTCSRDLPCDLVQKLNIRAYFQAATSNTSHSVGTHWIVWFCIFLLKISFTFLFDVRNVRFMGWVFVCRRHHIYCDFDKLLEEISLPEIAATCCEVSSTTQIRNAEVSKAEIMREF